MQHIFCMVSTSSWDGEDGQDLITNTCPLNNSHMAKCPFFLAENHYLRYDILAACQSLSLFHMENFTGRKVLNKWPKAVSKICLICFSASGCFTITVEQRWRELTPKILHLSSTWVQWRIFFNVSGNTVLLNPHSVDLVDHWLTQCLAFSEKWDFM